MADKDENVIVTLEFEDGQSIDCVVACIFTVPEYPGKEYAAVCPVDESLDDIYIFGLKMLDNDEADLFDIDDDEEFAAAEKELDRLIDTAIDD